MYKEAINFHKFALPVFLGLCFLFVITSCGTKRNYYTYNQSEHNVYELTQICNNLEENQTFNLENGARLTMDQGDCILEVNYPQGEDNE